MKKNGLFKILIILMFAILLLTWFMPAGYYSNGYVESGILRLGFFDFCQYMILPFFQSMFIEVLVFLLAVGSFYGILSKLGVYRSTLEKIAKKLEKKGTLFLVITTFVFAALSSFGGYGLLMFIFIPVVISLILLMGYDKMTAMLVTFMSSLIGTIGTTFGSAYISSTLSVVNATYTSQIYFKVALFVLVFAAYAFFIVKYSKKAKLKKEAKVEDQFLGTDVAPRKKSWPIYLIFGLLFIFLVLGCTKWNEVFGIEAFTKLHSAITEFAIKDYTIFSYLLGGTAVELGNWSYFQLSIILILISLIVGKAYKIKLSETLDNMLAGAKKIVQPALLVTFSYGILVLIANTGIFTTFMSYFLEGSEKFNMFVTSIITIIGSALHVELPYVANFFMPYLTGVYNTELALSMMNVMSQALYGATMLLAPTSLVLLLGLTYLDISYKKWLKFSWKLILEIFILIFVVLITMFIIIK